MEIVRVCHYLGCGKEFVAHCGRAKYCPECRIKRDEDIQRAARERRRTQKELDEMGKPAVSIQDIAAMARQAGMTYGQYVAREVLKNDQRRSD